MTRSLDAARGAALACFSLDGHFTERRRRWRVRRRDQHARTARQGLSGKARNGSAPAEGLDLMIATTAATISDIAVMAANTRRDCLGSQTLRPSSPVPAVMRVTPLCPTPFQTGSFPG